MKEHPQYFTRHVIEDIRDGQVVGFIEWRLAPGGTAEIVEIEVESEHRRTGVGRRMLERMLAELTDDTAVVYAFTRESNAVALTWYASVGFSRMQPLVGFYGDGGTAVICWRTIK